jgi:hypothetical protein
MFPPSIQKDGACPKGRVKQKRSHINLFFSQAPALEIADSRKIEIIKETGIVTSLDG